MEHAAAQSLHAAVARVRIHRAGHDHHPAMEQHEPAVVLGVDQDEVQEQLESFVDNLQI